jgi:hypothetical protein
MTDSARCTFAKAAKNYDLAQPEWHLYSHTESLFFSSSTNAVALILEA